MEDLEQRQHELDDATRISDDLKARLAESRKIDNELRAELIATKGDLEKLRSTDMQNARALEDAQELAERLLNKVSKNLVSF
jgi:cell division septum initiation protein DivIVA